ncbi:MAG: hypothetical protein IJS32_03900 [Kiritimatiellae bacterium]|nr:hypothetical protein [Kiritimatiellia bacterium]
MRFRPLALAAVPLLLALAVFLAAFSVRRALYRSEVRLLSPDAPLPFVLESALAFRRVEMAYRLGSLPVLDRGISWPDAVEARALDTLGSERAYAFFARRLPGNLPLPERVRFLSAAWVSLSAPALFLFVWGLLSLPPRPVPRGAALPGGLAAGLLWAVSALAVARSTGQDLMHENDAFPLLLFHLAALAWGLRWSARPLLRRAFALVSGILLAQALCRWDGIQLYAYVLAAFGAVLAFRFRRDPPRRRVLLETAGIFALCLAAAVAFNPYLRHHVFSYAGSYGHFASLLWAKLRFHNVRPADPKLLTFDQRILWTPALHSLTGRLLRSFAPVTFPLLLLAAGFLLASPRGRAHPATAPLLAANALFFALFVLFFRFSVWVAIFSAALCGLAAGLLAARARGWAVATLAATLLLSGGEAARVLATPVRWASAVGYYPELRAMTSFLRTQLAGEPVVANFGVSGAIAAYGGCPVVLHPKFETRDARDRVESYATALFKGDEDAFAAWMEAHDAAVYVHAMGEFSHVAVGYQMRFMVDALDPPEDAAARLFEQRMQDLKRFKLVHRTRKYRVFILRGGATARAHVARRAEQAEEALSEGRLHAAAAEAEKALVLAPDLEAAARTLEKAERLQESGFPSADDEWDALPLPWAPAG